MPPTPRMLGTERCGWLAQKCLALEFVYCKTCWFCRHSLPMSIHMCSSVPFNVFETRETAPRGELEAIQAREASHVKQKESKQWRSTRGEGPPKCVQLRGRARQLTPHKPHCSQGLLLPALLRLPLLLGMPPVPSACNSESGSAGSGKWER